MTSRDRNCNFSTSVLWRRKKISGLVRHTRATMSHRKEGVLFTCRKEKAWTVEPGRLRITIRRNKWLLNRYPTLCLVYTLHVIASVALYTHALCLYDLFYAERSFLTSFGPMEYNTHVCEHLITIIYVVWTEWTSCGFKPSFHSRWSFQSLPSDVSNSILAIFTEVSRAFLQFFHTNLFIYHGQHGCWM
jgi:hypothetical protein